MTFFDGEEATPEASPAADETPAVADAGEAPAAE